MASSGSLLTTPHYSNTYGDNVYLKFSWSIQSQSADNNTTKISWKLTGQRTASKYVKAGGFRVIIDGDTVYDKSTDYRIELYNGTVVASGTKTLTHNADGTRSFKVSIRGAIYERTVFKTGESTFTLDTIARASKIEGAASVTLGDACMIAWIPASSAFYYKLVFSIGDFSKTISGIAPKKTSIYEYTGYKIPIDGPAQQIASDKTQGKMNVTLTTHKAATCTSDNQIGSASSTSFSIFIPENDSTKPAVSFTLSPVSLLPAPFSSMYIKGKTKVKAVITGTGKYGATPKYYGTFISGESSNTIAMFPSNEITTGYVSTAGSVTVTAKVRDSRYFSNTATQTINVIDYNSPVLLPATGQNYVICARCDADGDLTTSGEYLLIKAKRSYSKVMSGDVQNNFCAIRYRVAQEGTEFTGNNGWVTVLAKDAASDEVTAILSGVVPSAETAYIVQVGLIDDIGSTTSIQFSIPTDFVTIDVPDKYKGKRMGLMRYAQDSSEPGIDVGVPIYGGSIDSLKLGTHITANSTIPASLNDYKTPGCYYSKDATNSKYITNSPYTDGGFCLVVRELPGTNCIRQELFYGTNTWIRTYISGGWSTWVRYQTTTST